MRIRIPHAGAIVAVCLLFLGAPLSGQQGMISGIVFDVESEEGEPATNIPIALVGTSGTSPVATTGTSGSATVPYTSSIPTGTEVRIVSVTVSGGMQIELVPPGATSESCEEARQRDEDECDDVGVILWGVTPNHQVTLGRTFSQYLTFGDATPPASTATTSSRSAGVYLVRSRELGAFRFGVQGTWMFTEAFDDGQVGFTAGMGRSSIGPDVSVWVGEALAEFQKPMNESISFIGQAGLAFDRQNSEFASGTDVGPTVKAGARFNTGDNGLSFTLGRTSRRNAGDYEISVVVSRNW